MTKIAQAIIDEYELAMIEAMGVIIIDECHIGEWSEPSYADVVREMNERERNHNQVKPQGWWNDLPHKRGRANR